MKWFTAIFRCIGPLAVGGSLLAMAACGSGTSTTGAAVAATPSCPTRPGAGTIASVNGTITTLAAGTFTVTDVAGKVTTVQYAATTRITHLQVVPATALTAGTTVQVITKPTQANGVTLAQTVIVQTASTGTGGGTGGGRGGVHGRAGCVPGGAAAGLRGVNGTIGTYNASTQQLTVIAATGTTYLITCDASTLIATSGPGSAADLTQGATVTVRGTSTGTNVIARQIQVLTTGQ